MTTGDLVSVSLAGGLNPGFSNPLFPRIELCFLARGSLISSPMVMLITNHNEKTACWSWLCCCSTQCLRAAFACEMMIMRVIDTGPRDVLNFIDSERLGKKAQNAHNF